MSHTERHTHNSVGRANDIQKYKVHPKCEAIHEEGPIHLCHSCACFHRADAYATQRATDDLSSAPATRPDNPL